MINNNAYATHIGRFSMNALLPTTTRRTSISRRSATKIIVAQRVATAKNADKIIVLDGGNIIAFDSHENLLNNCEVYQDIYNSQLKREGVFGE